ncbi:aminotransferase [Klosneuvirus KNV1]|uniref:Aminotransferase n=1 Tax=Klosneuvirus KNV1 TaxID=1977640 RepID=A0A1V0SLB8_9VIRU|nr:aminotransferase [Klosneuvirus KNV1]
MNKISWVNHKTIDHYKIGNNINKCITSRQFTNGGQHVKKLQNKLKQILRLDDNKEVIMTCNGAMAINALIGCFCKMYNKQLKFAVQAFTFPCSRQGLLSDSIIIDIDEHMGPDINILEQLKDQYDGVLITNCFGCSVNINLYEQFCRHNNKILLFDNASSPFTIYQGKNILNYGDGCIISLHHTKPIGFGEGGAIIINKKYKEEIEKIICFGYSPQDKYNYDIYASNYKMSEISAIYIDQWLDHFEKIKDKHKQLIKYFLNIMKDTNIKLFQSYSNYEDQLMPMIPIISLNKMAMYIFTKNKIEVKKYYYPLDINCHKSMNLFDKIVCLPLHMDMKLSDLDRYKKIIVKYF